MDGPPANRGGGRVARLIFLAILAAGAAGFLSLRDDLSLDALARHRADLVALRDAHPVAAPAAFVVAYAAMVALSLPGATAATLAGGFLFGVFPGVAYNVAGATAGAVLVFLAARAGFGARFAARMAAQGGRAARLAEGLRRSDWSVLLLMRLMPVVPFFLANLIPAFLGVRLDRFAITTALGILPAAVVFTAAGAGLGEVLARGEAPDLSLLSQPAVLLPLLGLCVLAALPLILRRMRP